MDRLFFLTSSVRLLQFDVRLWGEASTEVNCLWGHIQTSSNKPSCHKVIWPGQPRLSTGTVLLSAEIWNCLREKSLIFNWLDESLSFWSVKDNQWRCFGSSGLTVQSLQLFLSETLFTVALLIVILLERHHLQTKRCRKRPGFSAVLESDSKSEFME